MHRRFVTVFLAACARAVARRACAGLWLLAALFASPAPAQNVNDGYLASANGTVYAIVMQADGKALVGGSFTQVNSQPCSHLCRLLADGSVDPTFINPNADSEVMAIIELANGRLLVGGNFSVIGGQTRNRVARLNADGSLDTSFADPGMDGGVARLALQPDGRILVGGGFTTIGGQQRSNLGRLNANGSLDTGFANPALNGGVNAMALQADGKVLVGGGFTTAGGQARGHLARINANGSLDTGFANANANDLVRSLAMQDDGRVLAGGYFTTIGGQARNKLARLNTDGSLDSGFANSGVSSSVYALAVQPDGQVLIGGAFGAVAGQARNRVARLNDDGSLDTSFADPGSASGIVYALAVQQDDRVLIGGAFAVIGGQTRDNLGRLNIDGSFDVTFADPGTSMNSGSSISSLALQSDGKLLVGGSFTMGGGQTRNNVARFNLNGSLDTSFATPEIIKSPVLTVKGGIFGPDKILVGGYYERWGPFTYNTNCVFLLNPDGSGDDKFRWGCGANSNIYALTVGGDDWSTLQVLVGGAFTTFNGETHNHVVRLKNDGWVDAGFADPGAFAYALGTNDLGNVTSLVLQPDGRILVGGRFSSVGGQTRWGVARFFANGGLDPSFADPGAIGSIVSALALQPDGKLLIGGNFNTIGIQPRYGVARLNDDGSLDTSFANPYVSVSSIQRVGAIVVQPDGRVLIGGTFGTVSGQHRAGVARLNADGSLDTSFADPGTNGIVSALAVQADGRVLISGSFTGQARSKLARLSLPEAALQSLDIQGGTVTWRRSGPGPELVSPPILYYSNFSNGGYVPFGPMTRIAGGWQLDTSISFPVGRFYYLRVQGRTSGGSGSQGLIQTVRRFWRDDRVFANGFE